MKHRIAVAMLAAFALVPALPAGAQTQYEINEQAAAEYRKADAELNAVYRKLLGHPYLSAQEKARLIKAQRAWIAFRDAEMALGEAGGNGGSMAPMTRDTAATRVTRNRIRDLKAHLADHSLR